VNTLYYGDNIDVLREHIASESVGLIYLDPPFNSKRDYNLLFKSPEGERSQAQVTAFEDTWQWGERAAIAFDEVMRSRHSEAATVLNAMRAFLGESDAMAYLAMMAGRLIELHRVLKSTGSIYLHCDSTASHYLKILMDSIFESRNFRNEITWKRSAAHSDAKAYGKNTDILLFFSKSNQFTFNTHFQPYTDEYRARFKNKDKDGRAWQDDNLTAKGLSGGGYEYAYKGVSSLWRCPPETMERLDKEGRLHFTRKGGIRLKRYLDEMQGIPCQALWDDIPPINSQSKERLGYPTQKPLALLERIIAASSNPDDIVLDPFCGCGTAVDAAEMLGRNWLGIDITHLAVGLIERRLKKRYPDIAFEIKGIPRDIEGLREMARQARDNPRLYYELQYWAINRIPAAQHAQSQKKGTDKGIDGVVWLRPSKGSYEKALISVKAGDNVGVQMLRDLRGVIEREKAKLGIFLTLAEPTKPMRAEAAAAGMADLEGVICPKIQILTELLQFYRGLSAQGS
jgi:DNA modification methylase